MCLNPLESLQWMKVQSVIGRTPNKTLHFYLLSVWFPPESIVVVLIIPLTFFCTLYLSPLESLQWMKGQVINTTYLMFLIYSNRKTSYLATWKQQDNNTFIISRARSDLYHDLHITFVSFLALVSFNSCFDLNYICQSIIINMTQQSTLCQSYTIF